MKRAVVSLVLTLGLVACASVLGLRGETRRRFEHRVHVHRGVSCVRCHAGMQDAGEDGPLHLPETPTCVAADCHVQPHETVGDRAWAQQRCRDCHGVPWEEAKVADAKRHLRFDHKKHLPSAKGNCARCHPGARADDPFPPMGACVSCHEHQEEFDGRRCEPCHVDLVAEGSRPKSHVPHREDFVQTHGIQAASNRDLCETCHSQRFCASCHGVNVPGLTARLAFDQVQLAGLHRAGFRSRHREEAAQDPGLCYTCHQPKSCQECHMEHGVAATGAPTRNPHPRGWIGLLKNDHGPAAQRDPAACAACHGGAGEMLCVNCHKVGGIGGSVHPAGWRSKLDKSISAPCRLCHYPP